MKEDIFIQEQSIKFAYGDANFSFASKKDVFYIDKTHFIPLLEDAGKCLVFLRPRRFGKSLIVSMLEHYYDIIKKDQFKELFKHLFIGNNSTEEKNSYFVMNLNFSNLEIHKGVKEFEQSLNLVINDSIRDFKKKYKGIFKDEEIIINQNDHIESFMFLTTTVQTNEYDASLNRIFSESQKELQEHLNQKKSKEEYYNFQEEMKLEQNSFRRFFTTIKMKMESGAIGRVYITGVSPMVLNDFSSGFNISTHITHEPDFTLMCGFTEENIKKGIEKIIVKDSINDIIKIMEENYEGYKFNWKQKEKLYNPSLSIYFMRYLIKYKEIPEEKKLIDKNVHPSEYALNMISLIPFASQTIDKLLSNLKYGLYKEETIDDILQQNDLLKLSDQSESFLLSLMYYLGILTHGESKSNYTMYKIPNKIIKKEFIDKLLEILEIKNRDIVFSAINELLSENNIEPLCKFLEEYNFMLLKSNDIVHFQEMDLKVSFIVAIVSVTNIIPESEYPLEEGKDYIKTADIVIQDHNIHIEFKNLMIEELIFKNQQFNLNDEWSKGIDLAKNISNASLEEILAIKLKEKNFKFPKFKENSKGNYLKKDLSTVQDAWDNLKEQTKQNNYLLKMKLNKNINSYSIMRVGLYKLLYEKLE